LKVLTVLSQDAETKSAFQVSAVIATRNSEKTIRCCVESLLGEVAEIIVVDGGSSDGTLSILRQYPKVKVITEGGGTFHAAYNSGFKNCRSNFVMFIDSDAYIVQGFFPQALAFFVNNKVGIVACTARVVVSNRLSKAMSHVWDYRRGALAKYQEKGTLPFLDRLHARFFMSEEMHSGSTVTGPCYIVRRKSLEEIGGFPKFGDDYVMGELIKRSGYSAIWYTTDKLFHFSRTSLDSLLREYLRYGLKAQATSCRYFTRLQRLRGILVILVTMGAGILVSKESKDPLPIFLVPLLRMTQLIGQFVGIAFLRTDPDQMRVD
jgi:glycosyltransferase involved in cell wall biosynthesis